LASARFSNQKPKPVLTVTANPAVDKTVWIDGFRAGGDFRARRVILSAGGKGINVSRALKSLKTKSLATGFLGGNAGHSVQTFLKRENLDRCFLETGGETRTHLTLIDRKNGKITRLLQEGPFLKRRLIEKFRKTFVRLAKKSSCIVFSGSTLPGTPASFYPDLIQIARKMNLPVFLDTSGKNLFSSLRAKPLLIKPNLAEAQKAVRGPLASLPQIRTAVRYFLSAGAAQIILSLGEKGAVASDGKNFWKITPPKLVPVNTVGCGDALIAGFVSSYLRKENFESCIRSAVAAGSASALSPVPGALDRKTFLKILRKTRAEKLS